MSVVKAMKAAGLPIDVETAYRRLEEIVNERGPDDTRHFDTLLERLGLKWNPEVIAAGVVAYRATSPIYLTPFPDTVPTLLKLRDAGYKLGIASKGRATHHTPVPLFPPGSGLAFPIPAPPPQRSYIS